MIDIRLDNKSAEPIYEQICEQFKQLIANNQLKPGEHLPTVRELSHRLQINPATVARAYQELQQEGILGASRRRGTIVLGDSESPQRAPLRQNRLSGIVNNLILETLSQGYKPEELEAAFTLQLARWRLQRESTELESQPAENLTRPVLRFAGSNDLALDLLINRYRYENPGTPITLTTTGSLGGLLGIQTGQADIAGVHLLDEETGEYNYPYVKHILQNIPVTVIHLADRIQGLMVIKGNPKNIHGLEDLNRTDVTFANRQKGSGTRVWLDYKLRELGITPYHIKGYLREMDTHIAVGMSISKGESDVGLGIQAAAKTCNLDFLPLTSERFDLVVPTSIYRSKMFSPLVKIIRSVEFKRVVDEMGGYDTAQTGKVTMIK